MKYLKFDRAYMIEGLADTEGNAIMVPFETFVRGVVLTDNRWGKSIKTLTMLMDLREKVRSLSLEKLDSERVLALTDEEWEVCLAITEEPTSGYNVVAASACMSHVRDLKYAENSLERI